VIGARDEIVAAARACVGARFRAQGRDAVSGLDCVGLAVAAYGARLTGSPPASYAQRGGSRDAIAVMVARTGLRPVAPAQARTGDLLLFASGPGQWHFAVLTGAGFIHADARLRRVVEVPGRPEWPVDAAWSALAEGED
jgi:murein DD-endopeptidase / murein LD-carboxypeptidase